MYYILYGILYLVSLLPFFILYRISDFAFFLAYRIAAYRKQTVLDNLAIAFPEKTFVERKKIAREFYANLLDTFVESIKMLSMSEKEFDKRALMNVDEINALSKKGLTIQFMGGHQMNWEYANWAASKRLELPFAGIYMQIKNEPVNKLFYNLRKKYGTVLISATEFKTRMHAVFNKKYAIGLVADQMPGFPPAGYWLNFFGKPTAFVTGPDKGARKINAAVVFTSMVKLKRGYFRFDSKVITEHAASYKEGELTILYRDFLEDVIRKHPDNYLWSHRRWKWDYQKEYEKRWIDVVPPPGEVSLPIKKI